MITQIDRLKKEELVKRRESPPDSRSKLL
ncbi:hypothetical protein [Aureimonas ureilytica]